MSEKVKLPKAVCDALDYAKKIMHVYDYGIVKMVVDRDFGTEEVKILNKQNPSEIMRALVLGYEPKQTPEEQLKERYENRGDFCTYEHFLGYRDGVKDALHLHGIKYDWIKGWGEDDAE